jgi:multidrug efflux pump subunit AcrA (membrane-fusion protein)
MKLVLRESPAEPEPSRRDTTDRNLTRGVVAAIATIHAEVKTLQPSVRAQGVVTYDTRNIQVIAARVGGRLDRVYFKYLYQAIQKGDKVADIYSPELIVAQRELRYLNEHDASNKALIESAKKKLSLLGASPSQIEDVLNGKEVSNTFTVYSPFNGFIINDEQPALPMSPAAGTDPRSDDPDMARAEPASAAKSSTGDATLVREGAYVSRGQTLFKIANSSSMRIDLQVRASDAGGIKAGDEIQLDLGDGIFRNASIDFVQPFFGKNEPFLTVRVYMPELKNLRIGQLIQGTIQAKPVEALWIPAKSVLDLGLDRIVFIKEHGVFKARKVVTGVHAAEWVEVREGVTSSDEIAGNAHFLVDSESFIRERSKFEK